MGKASGGWRDAEGHTASERKRQGQAQRFANVADRVRNRPLSLVKPALIALFVAVLIFAFVLRG